MTTEDAMKNLETALFRRRRIFEGTLDEMDNESAAIRTAYGTVVAALTEKENSNGDEHT